MKFKAFALVAIMTICTGTPLKAEPFGDTRGWHRSGQAVIVIPAAHNQYRLYNPYRPHHRQNRMYRHHSRYNRLYHPLDRYYGIHQSRYRYNRLHYPRRSNLILRIGF